MSNCYVFTLGKNTYSSCNESLNLSSNPNDEDRVFLKSMCYYDWIEIHSVLQKESIDNLLCDARDEIEKIRICYSESKNYHIQQSLILLSENEDDVLSSVQNSPSLVYISFINVTSSTKIPFLEKNENISLYHTFDHCDYVLVANGDKLSLVAYMDVLHKIKEDENVHDIISLYAYIPGSNLDKEKSLSAVVNVGDYNQFANMDFSPNIKISTLGRYDTLLVYDNISFDTLVKLTEQISTQNDSLVSTKVHIGVDIKDLQDKLNGEYFNKDQSEDINSKLCVLGEKIFDYYCDSYRKSNLEKNVSNVSYFTNYLQQFLFETQKMIISTLNRGISQYYILSFIESFYGLLEYIDKKILKASNIFELSDKPRSNKDYARTRSELIIDVMNKFFNHMQSVSTSMLHSERKFIQTDPYQLMYFDIPPKLIAFYTAIANQMVCCLSDDKTNNKYHFLLCPDFKNDIYVDSLTQNRDLGNEQNILIIHINDKEIYNISNTIATIAHEIAHHVGQTADLRKKRAKLYVKSLLACLLIEIYSDNYTSIAIEKDILSIFESEVEQYLFFEKLVNAFYDSIFADDLFNGEQYYYADRLVEYFVNKTKEFYDTDLDDLFSELTGILSTAYEGVSLSNYVTTKSSDFLKKLVSNDNIVKGDNKNKLFTENLIINLLAYDFIEMLQHKIGEIECHKVSEQGKLSYPMFEHIVYVFREGYADTQMLLLTADDDNLPKHYVNLTRSTDSTLDDELKRVAVLQAFCPKDDFVVSGSTKLYKHYYTYICRNASDYFSELILHHNTSRYSEIRQIVKSISIETNTDEFIDTINKTIDSYKNRLLEQDFGIE
ncbi:MAG: hypothetical protein IJ428_02410 [Clostridia bacterium]|nr:hypothetical protein [Clostridia bacterium]